jgi:SPP1 gp7 family putative phage head morphogenesis protein
LATPYRVLPPDSVERAYFKKIRQGVELIASLISERLIPEIPALAEEARRDLGHRDSERTDDYPDKIGFIMSGIRVEVFRKLSEPEIKSYVQQSAADTDAHVKRELAKNFRRVLGVSLEKIISDRGIRNQFNAFVKENVALIGSIKEEYLKKVENMTIRTVSTGAPTAELAKKLVPLIDLEKDKAVRRAKFIARDQINKLNGRLHQARQTSYGITKYRWSTLNDRRVRGRPGGLYPDADPSHWARRDKIFSWDDPPEGGHPGEDYNCRCSPIPVFEEE